MTDLNVDRRSEEDAPRQLMEIKVKRSRKGKREREREREREGTTKIESTGRGMKVACVLLETLATRGIS